MNLTAAQLRAIGVLGERHKHARGFDLRADKSSLYLIVKGTIPTDRERAQVEAHHDRRLAEWLGENL